MQNQRVVISEIHPQIEQGRFPVKRIIGDWMHVSALIFADGHAAVVATLRYRKKEDENWQECDMYLIDTDRFQAKFALDTLGTYLYTISASIEGSLTITHSEQNLQVVVDPPLARFSSWYEFFPRSTSPDSSRQGTLVDCIAWLPHIATMGFDVVYLPPIHPIGQSSRKGTAGSPWAIGAKEGGHKAIDPLLGTMQDFDALVVSAKEHGIKLALDLAFQCSPDHPYIHEHPEWFLKRPDGTIKHAENPPKKYEDIVPFHFESEAWKSLWEELKSIVFFWIDKGIRVFRVDNPHTKPFSFWQWLIEEVKKKDPEVIFLSEAFTRASVMHWLAKVGFSQSYTYFTWRYTKHEIMDYMLQIMNLDYFRPCLWTNTPDILPLDLQYDGEAAFMIRLLLAATLSSNYGVYGPPFEAMEKRGQGDEYIHTEKYEITWWHHNKTSPLKALMTKINQIRRKETALQRLDNLKFYDIVNRHLLYFAKDTLLIVINLNPYDTESATLTIPLEEFNLPQNRSYHVHELLEDRHSFWEGNLVDIRIDPKTMPARIFKISTAVPREKNFEYFI